MKKIFALFVLLNSLLAVNSQTLSPSVVASAGGYVQNTGGSLSYTIGEMTVVQTFSNNNNILTQGFQQPEEMLASQIASTAASTGAFVLYPNPAVDNLWFAFQFEEAGAVNVTLLSELGQQIALVYHAGYEGGEQLRQMDVSKLAAASYFLKVEFTSKSSGNNLFLNKKFIVIR